jgi:hypothetical protein
MLYLHANVQKAGQITENEIKSKDVSAASKVVQIPASGFGIKTAMLLKHNCVSIKLNLPGCKRVWQCKCG